MCVPFHNRSFLRTPMVKEVSEQEKWEEILRKEGLQVGQSSSVPIAYVGTTSDLEVLQAKIVWDVDLGPEEQENENSTEWDKRWSYIWNHLYEER